MNHKLDTGRIPSDPNMQNIPIRTSEGRRIHDCFSQHVSDEQRPASVRTKVLADTVREGSVKSIWRTRWQEIREDVPDSPRKALVDIRLLTGEPKHIPRTLSAEALDRLSIWLEGHEAKR